MYHCDVLIKKKYVVKMWSNHTSDCREKTWKLRDKVEYMNKIHRKIKNKKNVLFINKIINKNKWKCCAKISKNYLFIINIK